MKLPSYNTHGMLLSPELVKANMANAVPDWINPQRKGETRRDTRLQKINEDPDKYRHLGWQFDRDAEGNLTGYTALFVNKEDESEAHSIKCPYGVPGDLLYFKERHYRRGHWEKSKELTKKKKQPKWSFIPQKGHEVRFDHNMPPNSGTWIDPSGKKKWFERSSLFLPEIYARQWSLFEKIGIERLQNITEEAAINEGVERVAAIEHGGIKCYRDYVFHNIYLGENKPMPCMSSAVDSFATLIDYANKPGTWEKNPWVWVVKYRPLSFDGRPSEYTIRVAREELFEPISPNPEVIHCSFYMSHFVPSKVKPVPYNEDIRVIKNGKGGVS